VTRLGIVAALPAEAKCLANRHHQQACANAPPLECAEEVSSEISGIGPERAGIAAASLVNRGAIALLSWGCAGALSNKTGPGDLLLPRNIIAADGRKLDTDSAWRARLASAMPGGMRLHESSLAESRDILSDSGQKQQLHEACGAAAVDMESAAIADIAHQANIPFMAIRAIADSADESLPACIPASMDDRGRLHIWRLIPMLGRHPRLWPRLLRLGRHFHAATHTLKMVSNLAGPLFHMP